MAWSVHDLDAGSDTIDGDDLAVFERLAADAIALVERANLNAGELAEALGTVRVVVVAVRQQHQRHLVCGGLQNIEVAFILRARIDDDAEFVFRVADDPGVRAFQCGVAGIGRQHDSGGGSDRTQLAVGRMLHAFNPTVNRQDV